MEARAIPDPAARARRAAARRVEVLERRDLPAATPLAVTARLGPAVDPDGNGVVLRPLIAIVGTTAPGAIVSAAVDGHAVGAATRAGGLGNYRLLEALPVGRTTFRVDVHDRAGAAGSTGLPVTHGDVLIDWNATMLDAVQIAGSSPPLVARNLAMAQVAVYDAVDAITGQHALYDLDLAAPRGAAAAAAASEAAYEVAVSLYPRQAAAFRATLAETLGSVPAGPSRARGVAFGRSVGDAILALRARDGSGATVAPPSARGPGAWAPTPPAYAPYLAPQFAFVTPFAMTGPGQFLPPPPPAPNSARYAADLDQVESLGAADSTTRTPDQTAYARFWSDLPGTTYTPPGHWNQIAQDAALEAHLDLATEARLFGLLDVALADAGISAWNAKYAYDRRRPVTAIRAANTDGNPATAADPTWTPLWPTPAFPSYTSAHSVFSGAAATVLDAFFGADFGFTDRGSPTLAGLPPRHFAGFDRAADEAGFSRVVGGIHFESDNRAGLAEGRALGAYVLGHVMR